MTKRERELVSQLTRAVVGIYGVLAESDAIAAEGHLGTNEATCRQIADELLDCLDKVIIEDVQLELGLHIPAR